MIIGSARDRMLKKHFQGSSNSCCDSLHNGDSLACLYGRCRPKRGGEIFQVTANVDDGDADGNNDAEVRANEEEMWS